MMTNILYFLIFASSFLVFECSSTNQPWWLKIAQNQGPMVCAQEYVNDDGRSFSTPWTGGKLCGSETIVRFSCCDGYERTQGERGCSLVKPLKNLADTAKELGAQQFVKIAEQSGILPHLTDQGAYTVFVTRDKAFQSLTKDQERSLNGSKKSRSRPPVLLYTIAEGRLTTDDLPDALSTLYREGSAAVIKSPTGLISINCIPLVATDIEATNGIIHITETLLFPPGRNTISDLISRTPTLRTTAKYLADAQLNNELRDKKLITMFVPTDEAWESLPASLTEVLMGDPRSFTGLLKALLRYHIVESIWCSAVIAGKTELKSLEGSSLQISCNSTDQYVNQAKIIEKDLAARNGFIHHIDVVLIPDIALSLVECLENRGMTQFVNLLEIGGMLSLLKRHDVYRSVFAPTNDAFEALSNETMSSLFNNPSLARAVASYHIMPGLLFTSNIIDGQEHRTIDSRDSVLRLKIHKKRVTVEEALIEEKDLQVRNGIVHIIDKVLSPPTANILEELQEGNFSVFISLLNQTDPNLLQVLGDSSKTFTVFALNDENLNASMPPGMLPRLQVDPKLLYKILARHVLPIFVVSNILEPGFSYSFIAVSGESVTVKKESSNSITVARLAEVTRSDIVTKNGVLHEISRLLQI